MEKKKLFIETTENGDKFIRKISLQIKAGQELADLSIGSEYELKRAMGEEKSWSDTNRTILSQLFRDSRITREYYDKKGNKLPEKPVLEEYVGLLKEEVKTKTGFLKEILEIIQNNISRC